jgi:hypothetical protein
MTAISFTLGSSERPATKRLAFTYGHHSETNNYRPACARTGLAASRRPTLVVQEIHRVAMASTVGPTCIRWEPAVYRNRICGPLITLLVP